MLTVHLEIILGVMTICQQSKEQNVAVEKGDVTGNATMGSTVKLNKL